MHLQESGVNIGAWQLSNSLSHVLLLDGSVLAQPTLNGPGAIPGGQIEQRDVNQGAREAF
jgi:hypothetical protein